MKLEKLNYGLRKAQIDVEFVVICNSNAVVPCSH